MRGLARLQRQHDVQRPGLRRAFAHERALVSLAIVLHHTGMESAAAALADRP